MYSYIQLKTLRSKTAVRMLKREYAAEHPARHEIAFLLQDVTDPYNVGSMFRLADALGAAKLILAGDTPEPSAEGRIPAAGPPQKAAGTRLRAAGRAQIAVTSLGAHRRVPWRKIKSHEEAVETLIGEGWTLVAIEIADSAIPYTDFQYPEKLCLVLGSEKRGVYDKVLNRCAAAVFIPMSGKGRSLNVSHAAAIVGFRAAYDSIRNDNRTKGSP